MPNEWVECFECWSSTCKRLFAPRVVKETKCCPHCARPYKPHEIDAIYSGPFEDGYIYQGARYPERSAYVTPSPPPSPPLRTRPIKPKRAPRSFYSANGGFDFVCTFCGMSHDCKLDAKKCCYMLKQRQTPPKPPRALKSAPCPPAPKKAKMNVLKMRFIDARASPDFEEPLPLPPPVFLFQCYACGGMFDQSEIKKSDHNCPGEPEDLTDVDDWIVEPSSSPEF